MALNSPGWASRIILATTLPLTTKHRISLFSLPELGIPAIKARIDSGAKTSAIHAYNIQTYRKDNALWVNFEVHPLTNDRRTIVRCDAEVVDRRVVKSSSGISEKRYVIKTVVALGDAHWDIELTLTNRDAMGYRMLLGREGMKDRFIIDPSQPCINGDIAPETIQIHPSPL